MSALFPTKELHYLTNYFVKLSEYEEDYMKPISFLIWAISHIILICDQGIKFVGNLFFQVSCTIDSQYFRIKTVGLFLPKNTLYFDPFSSTLKAMSCVKLIPVWITRSSVSTDLHVNEITM